MFQPTQQSEDDSIQTRSVSRLRGGVVQTLEDMLVVEEPLEVRVGDEQFSVTMRTPGHDFELVRGLLLTEGVIERESDIGQIRYCDTGDVGDGETNIVTVRLRSASAGGRRWQRTLMAGTSCGLCGKTAIDALAQDISPLPDTSSVRRETLLVMPRTLREHQPLFSQTGGLHAVGLFEPSGECLCVFEDIGRHNATDKAIGYGVAQGWLPWTGSDPLTLVVSGRASFEITQKALVARIPIVCAVSAASSLAADLAQANNQTLVGFLRDAGMTIYAGAERVA